MCLLSGGRRLYHAWHTRQAGHAACDVLVVRCTTQEVTMNQNSDGYGTPRLAPCMAVRRETASANRQGVMGWSGTHGPATQFQTDGIHCIDARLPMN